MAYDGGANPLTQPLLEAGSADDAATGDVPVTPKPMGDPESGPESGPAYDSITSCDSNYERLDVSLSHVQPGQAIALPDGSVIPVGGGETTDNRSNMATGNSQPPYPPAPVQYSHTSTGAGPVRGPFPGHSYYIQQQPPLPSKIGATPGPAPGAIASPYVQSASPLPYKPGQAPSQAYPQQGLPSKPGATPGPAPSQAYPQQGLPSKHGATPGPAPGMTYPQQFPPGATPGPPPHAKGSEWSGPAPQYTGPYRYPHPMASNNQQPQYHPSSYNYNQQQRYRYPPPQPPYQQPYQARGPAQPLAPFPPTQYQPYRGPPPPTSYRGPPPVQVLGQGAAVPYYPYQGATTNQPKPRLPVKTSFKFNAKTVDDNHFYVAICLLVTIIVCVNPLGLLCTIPALIFGYISASANAKDDYEKALKYHKRARSCNIGTGAAIIAAGTYTVTIGIYVGFIVAASGG